MSRLPPLASLVVLGTLALAACGGSVSIGSSSVSKDEIAKQVSTALEQSVGSSPPPITCPDDLAAEVGKTTTCVMHASDGDYDVAVKITKVDGDTVAFDVEVADQGN